MEKSKLFTYEHAGGGFLWSFVCVQAIGFLYAALCMLIPSMDNLFLSGCITQMAFIGFYFVYTSLHKISPLSAARVKKAKPMAFVVAVVLVFVMMYGLIGLADLFDRLLVSTGYVSQNPLIGNFMGEGAWGFILAIPLFGILPAIGEELIFRGIVLQGLKDRLGDNRAVIISAVCFCVMHASPDQTVYQFFIGLALAYLTVRSGSILPAMLMHAVNNIVSLVFTRFGLGVFVPSSIAVLIPYALIAAAVTVVAVWLLIDLATGRISENALVKLFQRGKGRRNRLESVDSGENVAQPVAQHNQSSAPRQPVSIRAQNSTVKLCCAIGICVFLWVFMLISGYRLA